MLEVILIAKVMQEEGFERPGEFAVCHGPAGHRQPVHPHGL